ncbi:MAG: alanine racemase [Coriobacteriales bacterium]|jgi:alanine racemase|nr:alanine racemase [Coriobacteriales bacterium]
MIEPASSEHNSLPVSDRRWAWLEIDLEAIRQNLRRFRRIVGPDVMIMAVVKADGYGHGAAEVARTALNSGAKMLGVSNIDEGIALRESGIVAPVLVLAEPPISTVEALVRYHLIPTVYSMEFALAYGEASSAADQIGPYHLKVDTGMNRVGIHYSDAGDFLRTLDFHKGLQLQGVFTHFATADEADTIEFTQQYDRFHEALDNIRYMGIKPGIVHAANTAAAIRYRNSHFHMVRIGIGMYGLHPSNLTKQVLTLQPAMSLHARINFVKPVPMGEGVSYGLRYRSPGNVLIGTLPLGYADGIARELSGRIQILYQGQRLQQVGTICMDMMMFEADQRPLLKRTPVKPQVGEEVVIVGKSGDEEISLDEIAALLGTINYDVACRFGMRLDRVYHD